MTCAEMDAEQRELAELLYEEELADQEVAQFVASMQRAEAEARPAAPVMRHSDGPDEPPLARALFDRPPQGPPQEEVVITEYYMRMIRRKLHELCVSRSEPATLEQLARVLRRELNFTCGRRTLARVLREDGCRLAGRRELIRLPADQRRPAPRDNPSNPF